MKKRQCDLCHKDIPGITSIAANILRHLRQGVSFGDYDLCGSCVSIVRCAVCRSCSGQGVVNVRDDKATLDQANCGESRTQYRSIPCKDCT